MDNTPLSASAIDQACSWMARLWADDVTEKDHKDCEAWRKADPANEAAWQQVQQVRHRFEQMPDRKAGSQLLSRRNGLSRRQLLGFAGLGLGVSIIGADTILPKVLPTDYATATGEIRDYVLADGTRLILNTATRVDVAINDQQREIDLLEGEIWIKTGQHQLPLTVVTRDGLLQPLGTEFSIRQFDDSTRLSVYQGQVQLIPASQSSATRIIESGEGAAFTPSLIQPTFAAQTDAIAWIHGKLAVADMPLTTFIAELSRYRAGLLRASTSLSGHTVTGVFSLDDTDRILSQLMAIFPIKIQHITPWWLNVMPR